MRTRREFLQNVGGIGIGTLCLHASSAGLHRSRRRRKCRMG